MNTPRKTADTGVDSTRSPPELARAGEELKMKQHMPVEGIEWGGGIDHIEEMTVQWQTGAAFGIELPHQCIGWVLSGLQEYLDAGKRGTIDVPQYYSDFEHGFGDQFEDEGLYVGGIAEDGHGRDLRCLFTGRRMEAGMRACTGGGHYDPDRYTIHDAVPAIIIEGPNGVVAVMPKFHILNTD